MVALPADVGAQGGDPWDLAQLMQERREVAHARARFTEERHSALFERPVMVAGTLYYAAPARVEKHVESPFTERYIVDGDSLRIEHGAKDARTVSLRSRPLLWAFVESMRATLAGDLETLQRFYEVRLEGEREHWRLALVPLQEQMRALVEAIRIEGSGADVTAIEILEAGGDRSRMKIWAETS